MNLRGLFGRKSDRRKEKARRALRPLAEVLDSRLVPAVTSTFSAATGALVVTIDNNSSTGQNVAIRNLQGYLSINSSTAPDGIGVRVPSSSVKSIVVNGSNLANKIDLNLVDSRGFL